jgi:hypothetical protein
MKRRLPSVAVRLLAALLLLPGAGCEPKPYRVLARVLLVRGAVQTMDSGGNARTLRPADLLEAGSRLSVPAGAVAIVSLVPGVAALAVGASEMTLDALEMSKDGAAIEQRRARVTLRAGTARFSVGSPADRRIELEVLLKSAAGGGARLLAAPGAVFGVAPRGQRDIRVVCARGAVGGFPAAAAPGGWIVRGEFRDFGPGAPALARSILEDADAQRETAHLFAALPDLDALQEIQRDLTPFSPFP